MTSALLPYHQQLLYFASLRAPAAYTECYHKRLYGTLDVVKLATAIDIVFKVFPQLLLTVVELEQGKLVWKEVSRQTQPLRTSKQENDVETLLSKPILVHNGKALARFYLVTHTATSYSLIIKLQHLIFDGLSLEMVFQAINMYYNSQQIFSIGDSLPTFDATVPSSNSEFWTNYLKNCSPLALTPCRHVNIDKNCEITCAFSIELLKQKYAKCSPFKLLLAAYFILMHRYTMQDDITLCYPASIRPKNASKLFGYFVAMQPIRIQFNENTTFDTILQYVQDHVEHSNKHGMYGIASAFLSYEDLPVSFGRSFYFKDSLVLNDISIVSIPVPPRTSKNDLAFMYEESSNCIELHVSFNQSKYNAAYCRKMACHFKRILEHICEKKSTPVHRIEMLSPEEIKLALPQHKTFSLEFASVKVAVEKRVQEYSSKIAVICRDTLITYEELNKKANRIAHVMISKGIGIGCRVGIFLERNINAIIAIVAAIKTGATYVPIDTSYPAERRDYIINDSQLAIVLTDSQFSSCVLDLPYLNVEQIPLSVNNSNPSVSIGAESSLYILYTSGSTGKPKGVQIANAGILSLVIRNSNYPFSPETIMSQSINLSFDASCIEIYGSLLNGATLVMVPNSTLLDVNMLQSYFMQHKVNAGVFSAGVFNVLAAEKPAIFDGFNDIYVGGDVMSSSALAAVLNSAPPLRIHNDYGPTENAVSSSSYVMDCKQMTLAKNSSFSIPIGKALSTTDMLVLDKYGNIVPCECIGEIYVGGAGLAVGYWNKPDLTLQLFSTKIFSNCDAKFEKRLYKTGDLARYLPDGNVEFMGRIDNQVKIRGIRVELGEIEHVVRSFPGIQDVVVDMQKDDPLQRIRAFVMCNSDVHLGQLKLFAKQKLHAAMVPASFVLVDKFPLTSNGKIDKEALQQFVPSQRHSSPTIEHTAEHKVLIHIWRSILKLESVGIYDGFFEVGGSSLLLPSLLSSINGAFSRQCTLADLVKYPTIASFAKFLKTEESPISSPRTFVSLPVADSRGIAVIGMSCKFPKCNNIDEYWKNLCAGRDCISTFDGDASNFVPRRGIIDDANKFDAEFFGFSPSEAFKMDPQHKIFFECVWNALEDASINPKNPESKIGIFAGKGHVNTNWNTSDDISQKYANSTGTFADFLSTRVAHKLNLKGPALTIQTACSTSLSVVHTACMYLKNNECDVAIAGACSLGELDSKGYTYQEGMIFSKDGNCCAFDKNSTGTVLSQGCGVVILKKYSHALRDGDHVYAVIKGSAMNNDGSSKVGFTAPSIEGQTDVLKTAYANANIDANSISFIEAHGTGTVLGDAVEISALKKVFTKKTKHCALGSVKTNIGHTDTASGMASLIKTCLAIYHNVIPPTLHFKQPNAELIDSAFFVNTSAIPWRSSSTLRAGVSNFGIGGTNVHLVLEEAGKRAEVAPVSNWNMLCLSATNSWSLQQAVEQLRRYISQYSSVNIADVAYSLSKRQSFSHRVCVAVCSPSDAVKKLQLLEIPKTIATAPKRVVFLFPGQGMQLGTSGNALYSVFPVFRVHANICMKILNKLGVEVLLFSELLANATYYAIALFVLCFALSKTVQESFNVQPAAMIGHSLGEYVCACISGVIGIEDALFMLCRRTQLLESIPNGSMLAVNCTAEEASVFTIPNEISIAAINGPNQLVFSGIISSIDKLQQKLTLVGKTCTLLNTTKAMHSVMVEPIMKQYGQALCEVSFSAPSIPYISCTTGSWITADQATSNLYWTNQMRQPVDFVQSMKTVLQNDNVVFLELGPGKIASSMLKKFSLHKNIDVSVISFMKHAKETKDEVECVYDALGQLWQNNIPFNMGHVMKGNKISLPNYPFKHQSSAAMPISPIAMTATENSIVQVWRSKFGYQNISSTSNFGSLGGDSLLAVSIVQEINQSMNLKLLPSTLLQYPTVIQLAAYVEELAAQKESPLAMSSNCMVEIRKGSETKSPIFFVHPIGGDIFYYSVLGSLLKQDRSCYAFRASSLDGTEAATDNIEKLASKYVALVDQKQANKKQNLMLGGASFGGLVAYEMSLQLKSRGYNVELLLLIDAPLSGAQLPSMKSDQSILSYLREAHGTEIEVSEAFLQTWKAHNKAMLDYKTSTPFNGKALYFRPSESIGGLPLDLFVPWVNLVANMNIVTVPGNHITMITKHAKEIASIVNKHL